MANNNNSSGIRFFFDRSATELVNKHRFTGVYDYAYGRFLAWDHFFKEMSRLQTQVTNNEGVVNLGTGATADLKTIGGALALQIYTESLNSAKDAMDGLANLGLKNENKLWTLR
jgi:hypothetical protein